MSDATSRMPYGDWSRDIMMSRRKKDGSWTQPRRIEITPASPLHDLLFTNGCEWVEAKCRDGVTRRWRLPRRRTRRA